jgi:hypothetical protein
MGWGCFNSGVIWGGPEDVFRIVETVSKMARLFDVRGCSGWFRGLVHGCLCILSELKAGSGLWLCGDAQIREQGIFIKKLDFINSFNLYPSIVSKSLSCVGFVLCPVDDRHRFHSQTPTSKT